IVVSVLFRRLVYNSFDSQGAEYNQRYNQIVSIIFLVLLALTISITAQIVGALLIFVLLTIPASAAKYFAHTLWKMIGLTFIVVSVLFRRLVYNSFDSQGAEYNQRYNQIVSIIFLVLLALTISITAQIVGALLIFVLLTIPASAAKYFAHTLWKMIGLTFIFV